MSTPGRGPAAWFAERVDSPCYEQSATQGLAPGRRSVVLHLGDSRTCQRLEQHLQRLARDYSLIHDLIDAREVDAAKTDNSPANTYAVLFEAANHGSGR